MQGPCGPRKTLQVIQQPLSESQNQWSSYSSKKHTIVVSYFAYFFTILHLVVGVCADPAGTKLVSFFVKADEG